MVNKPTASGATSGRDAIKQREAHTGIESRVWSSSEDPCWCWLGEVVLPGIPNYFTPSQTERCPEEFRLFFLAQDHVAIPVPLFGSEGVSHFLLLQVGQIEPVLFLQE